VHGSPDNRRLSPNVFARWYRAPELLLGCQRYDASVDVWGAGMVLAELLLRRPWMPAMSGDVEQLSMIFGALGLPDTEKGGANAGPGGPWPGAANCPAWVPFRATGRPPAPLSAQFPGAPSDALDLLGKMLALDPARRPSARQCLAHPYFSNAPAPTPAAQLPRPPAREDNPLQRAPGAAADGAAERPSKVARTTTGGGGGAGAGGAAAATGAEAG
jgi:cyclin-dependent kinase 7